ncbi:flagellar biosynthesis protein FliO [Oryzifoliimicrobium ureilyticus]|uniref:flagellar biosynthesis protein FliO n=1 Tax=Oryzifoliimicrobium ureilyticus TaxID=3113724 RepID=UPI0030762060
MFSDVMGAYGGRFFVAAGGVGIALLVLIAVLWVIRSRAPSPFVRGGKNRQPRLQVLDAAAVDARRRLVLVRRDNIEHLIMIGGPTDIVIESGIGANAGQLPRGEDLTAPVTDRALPGSRQAISAPSRAEPVAEQREPISDQRPQTRRPLVGVSETESALATAPQRPAAPPVVETARDQEQQVRQSAPQRPAINPRTDEASDALEAARQRVLPQQQRIEPQVTVPVAANRQPEIQRSPATEFKRVLEEELNSDADRALPLAKPVTPNPVARREPDRAPTANSDADLQNEVARIFGEISVNRDNK